MSIKRLFDAVERRGDIGRRVAALVLPISNRPRVTSSCAGKIGLREPGEHTSGPNLASRDNVAHNQNLYTILETPPPVIPLCRKQARTYAIRWSMLVGVPRMLAQSCRRRTSTSPAVKSNAGGNRVRGPPAAHPEKISLAGSTLRACWNQPFPSRPYSLRRLSASSLAEMDACRRR
jgi:hypothetical protein